MISIGTDIVNIKRIEKIILKYNEKFLHKNFHPLEITKYHSFTLSDNKYRFIAKRFAAKEALLKALKLGIGNGIALRDIATLNDKTGAPKIMIEQTALQKLNNILPQELLINALKDNVQISLSDDYPFAIAFVVVNNYNQPLNRR